MTKFDKKRSYCCSVLWISSLAILTLARFGFGQAQHPSESLADWDKIRQHFETLYQCPCSENAKTLMNSIPKGRISKKSGDYSGMVEFIMDKYSLLETEVLAGNRYAAEVLFRLLSVSDGAFTSDILATIGLLIRINPKLFLDMVINYRESPFLKERLPVYGIGLEYVDNKTARRYEYEMRIKSLESIDGDEYAETIDSCVRVLKAMIF
jgi:hypothetical protein